MMLHTKYQGSRSYGFRHEDFFFQYFHYKGLVKQCDLGLGYFWPQGRYFNKLGRGPLGDAKYQISNL